MAVENDGGSYDCYSIGEREGEVKQETPYLSRVEAVIVLLVLGIPFIILYALSWVKSLSRE